MLVNNAAMMSSAGRTWSKNANVTEVFFVNHLAVVYLTAKLLPVLSATPGSRIVNVASGAHTMGHLSLSDPGAIEFRVDQMPLYGASKAANIIHARYLHSVFESCSIPVKIYSLHPGIIKTELHRGDKFPLSVLVPLVICFFWIPLLCFYNNL